MGCVGAKEINPIDQELKQYKKTFDKTIKLLLLGAGESGKSTFAKQIKLLHVAGFTDEEINDFKDIIYSNIIQSMQILIEECSEREEFDFDEGNEELAELVMEADEFEMTKEIGEAIEKLWDDSGIQGVYEIRHEFQLIESCPYYFDNIQRISDKGYVPSEEDIVRSRSKTTGIIEMHFEMEKTPFVLVDVGGQRSERRKWLHCFEDVTAILFLVGLSEYNMTLVEDETVNRMDEALKLFGEIYNSKWFGKVAMMLFLNKSDLFAEKIKEVDLNVCFPEYTGGCNYEPALEFIKNKFEEQNLGENPHKDIYIHVTCATDKGNVDFVFNAVKNKILSDLLDDVGI